MKPILLLSLLLLCVGVADAFAQGRMAPANESTCHADRTRQFDADTEYGRNCIKYWAGIGQINLRACLHQPRACKDPALRDELTLFVKGTHGFDDARDWSLYWSLEAAKAGIPEEELQPPRWYRVGSPAYGGSAHEPSGPGSRVEAQPDPGSGAAWSADSRAEWSMPATGTSATVDGAPAYQDSGYESSGPGGWVDGPAYPDSAYEPSGSGGWVDGDPDGAPAYQGPGYGSSGGWVDGAPAYRDSTHGSADPGYGAAWPADSRAGRSMPAAGAAVEGTPVYGGSAYHPAGTVFVDTENGSEFALVEVGPDSGYPSRLALVEVGPDSGYGSEVVFVEAEPDSGYLVEVESNPGYQVGPDPDYGYYDSGPVGCSGLTDCQLINGDVVAGPSLNNGVASGASGTTWQPSLPTRISRDEVDAMRARLLDEIADDRSRGRAEMAAIRERQGSPIGGFFKGFFKGLGSVAGGIAANSDVIAGTLLQLQDGDTSNLFRPGGIGSASMRLDADVDLRFDCNQMFADAKSLGIDTGMSMSDCQEARSVGIKEGFFRSDGSFLSPEEYQRMAQEMMRDERRSSRPIVGRESGSRVNSGGHHIRRPSGGANRPSGASSSSGSRRCPSGHSCGTPN